MQDANGFFEAVVRDAVALAILGSAERHVSEDNIQEEIRFPAVELSRCVVVGHHGPIRLRLPCVTDSTFTIRPLGWLSLVPIAPSWNGLAGKV